ncbi:Crp/Fnr family transcriptional regulator [Paracidovorax konjaci]|uniref:cAMP-binding domain of CRP or a regulatory subunit of cAMP-dependent protein kinases n=1 Tax=Paracidovorax konjaci TaxID=32040 RepID=A0A1I1T2R4_9BURK|nr:Crp/Fnr family transcriptional regulator [Paracidovorax konjaci]SFD52952.1 cAMP-binding domain of CRP or a regulatory subunit of cAMP-dependent protein kinases [Paracidovorax konjaci]
MPTTPTTVAADHLATLSSGRWFATLPADLAGALAAMAHLRALQAGEALFLRGDAPCGLYAVVRGAIDISGVGGLQPQARAALLTRLEPPAWFGEIAVFDRAPRTHDAHAAEPGTLLLQVPQAPLLAWLGAHPGHWHALALLLTDKLRTAFVALEELALLPAPERLARRLVLMAEGYGQWAGEGRSRRSIALSQEQLALMLALSRQTTNQILRDLQARGLLRMHRGGIEILDLAGLRAACA